MNATLTRIPKLKFSEPCHNLPGRKGTETAEDRFTVAFMRAYLAQCAAIHRRSRKTRMAFAREIPVNGYGIADLHLVAWDGMPDEHFPDVESFVRVVRPCTRAFECKLTNWRQAMAQAGRYRFFANQTFVVLPDETCRHALSYLATFQTIKTGLWGFNEATGKITPHYTPRPARAKSAKYYLKAISSVARASRQALPIP